MPPVLATAPTITLGERNGASQIPSSIHITAANVSTGELNPVYRFVGDPQRAGASFPDNGFVKNTAVTTTSANGNLVVEFIHFGSAFELYEKGQNGKYRLAIDEGDGYKYVAADAQSMAPSDGGVYNRLINFGSVKSRGIRIEISNSFFGGVRIGPNDTIYPPAVPPRPRAIFVGDSFTEGGSSGAAMSHSYSAVASYLLGWDGWNSGVGGTGYVNNGPAGRVKFQDRIQHDVLQYQPDVVVIAGGINDEGSPVEQTQAAADLLYSTIRSSLPNTELIVISNFSPVGGVSQIRGQIRDALRETARKYGAPFIDTLGGASYDWNGNQISPPSGSWITGSGNVGNPQASGNASVFTSADGTHPSPAGHRYLGERVAAEVFKIYNSK